MITRSALAVRASLASLAMLAPSSFALAGDVIWEQLPDGVDYTLSSQDDACYPFTNQLADDFVTDTDQAIQGVRWWGGYWNGTETPPPPTVRFEIWRDDLDEPCPSQSAERIYSEETGDVLERPADGLPEGTLEYAAALPRGFVPTPGERYWLSILLVFCYPPQWGIATGVGNDREACFRTDWGIAPWVAASTVFGAPYETAFVIKSAPPTPVAGITWSRLKGFYEPDSQRTAPGPEGSRGPFAWR